MVAIRTGELESAKLTPVEGWSGLLDRWQGFAYFFPDDCRKLKQMRDEISELEMWKELGYEDANSLISDKLLIDPRTVELVCLGLDVADTKSPVPMVEAVERGEKIAALAKQGKTQQAIADEVGVSQQRIQQVITCTPEKLKAESVRIATRQLYLPQCPIKAAEKIVDKFDADFVRQLKEAL